MLFRILLINCNCMTHTICKWWVGNLNDETSVQFVRDNSTGAHGEHVIEHGGERKLKMQVLNDKCRPRWSGAGERKHAAQINGSECHWHSSMATPTQQGLWPKNLWCVIINECTASAFHKLWYGKHFSTSTSSFLVHWQWRVAKHMRAHAKQEISHDKQLC